jgi:ubiquinone/menaquinone biosynthesis C-methylase UbiE
VTLALTQIEPTASYSAPFDAIAEQYDLTFSSSMIGQFQRAAVWRELTRSFRAGDRILDLGCGTGVDACFLAERGIDVIACDKSSQMLRVAAQKITALSTSARSVQLRLVPAEEVLSLSTDGPFDGAVSNFGAVNCVSDVGKLARDLARLLKPGASLLLCVIGPSCAWETAWYLLHGKPRKAFRRFRRGGEPAKLEGGEAFNVYYRSVSSMQVLFAPGFRLKSVRGVGVLVPPSYLEPWARRFPRLTRLAAETDKYLGLCPGIRGFADHILLRFERTEHCIGENN